jgi:hypothetical protein
MQRALSRRALRRVVTFASCALLAGALAAPPAGAATPSGAGHRSSAKITKVHTTRLAKSTQTVGSGPGGTLEFGPGEDEELDAQVSGSQSAKRVPAAHVPTPVSKSVVGANGATGFEGISHVQQRFAGSGRYAGTNFSTEPPDMGLCLGGNFVLQGANAAIRVFDRSGNPLTDTTPLNQLFGAAPAVIRSVPTFGDFIGDVKCYYDPEVQRFFVSSFRVPTDPATGAFEDESHVVLAVSATSNPTGTWNVYDLDTTDGDGTAARHPHCPCIADQPLIGADHFGFYITTNEFSLEPFGVFFNGGQVYAFSKTALASGAGGSLGGVHIDGIPLAESLAYTLQPATTPRGGAYDLSHGGTEWFLSALDFNGTLDNRIAAWALSGTSTLGSTNAVTLQSKVIASESYGQPPDAEQRNGPTPLRALEAAGLEGVKSVEHLELLAGNDDRMNEVKYAAGALWGDVNTVVKTENGNPQVGIAYFVVQPGWTNSTASATPTASILNQGYVSVNAQNVLYGAIAANNNGRAIMGFTLVGKSFFPSAAYVTLGTSGAASNVRRVAAGLGPEDGFTGYVVEGGAGTARWGDYSAATADDIGHLWVANEYIPRACPTTADIGTTANSCRSLFANWGTFVTHVVP